MIFEIINPSDPYTMECDDFQVACVTTLILGEGFYSIRQIGGDNSMPILLFGAHDAWFIEQFGKSFEQCLADIPYKKIADCLDSILIGSPKDRETYKRGLELIDDPAKRDLWRAEWFDKRRSSMNDIGGKARHFSEKVRQAA